MADWTLLLLLLLLAGSALDRLLMELIATT
jgi:hypothetical protein